MAEEDDVITAVDIPVVEISGIGMILPIRIPQEREAPGVADALVPDGALTEAPDGAAHSGREEPESASGPTEDGPAASVGKRHLWWIGALIAVWAVLAVVDVGLFHGSLGLAPSAASHVPGTPRASATSAASRSAAAPTPRATGSSPSRAATKVLAPVSAVAFGPTGTGSGDNAPLAENAIDGSMATDWTSDWYQTAEFGDLETGTGLLIDMGRPVTISSVDLDLGSASGADLELLAGNAPDQSAMTVRATATDVGGTVSLSLRKAKRARYLLVWFTLLPPDSQGTYQATVYNVAINGTG